MTVLGLEDGKVTLYPHEMEWERIAADMIEKIRAIMKDDILDIQHVGGTSIRCAWAKPIIDIMILLPDLSVIEKYLPQLAELGIEYVGEIVPRQHLGFIRTPDGKGQTFHIHFADPETLGWYEIINIRDFCNTDPLGGKVYSDSKRLYSRGNEDVRLSYREEKNNMYVVIRQASQAMRDRQEGRKTGSNFIDTFFMTCLASLEQNAVVYKDGRPPVRYKELAGRLVRAGAKLRNLGLQKGERILIHTDDIARQLTLILGASYIGCASVLTEKDDRDALSELQKNTDAKVLIEEDFFADLMNVREHLPEELHRDEDLILLFPDQKKRVIFGEFSSAVMKEAEGIQKNPDHTLKEDHRLISEQEIISLLACLSAGGVISIG